MIRKGEWYKGFEIVSKLDGGSDDISELSFGVGELCPLQPIHNTVISGDLEEPEEHFEGVVLAGVFVVQHRALGHDHIHYHISLSESLSQAIVDSSRDIEVPDGGSIDIRGVKGFDWGVEADGAEGSVEGVDQIGGVSQVGLLEPSVLAND